MSQHGNSGPGGPHYPPLQGQTPTGGPQYPQAQGTGGTSYPLHASGFPELQRAGVPSAPAANTPVPAPRATGGVGAASAPYPSQGQPAYPQQGQSPYPLHGSSVYPAQGQSTNIQPGQPNPSNSSAPYPSQGQTTSNPQQGQTTPYPQQTLPQKGPAPYPPGGQGQYPAQGQAPYPPVGPGPYPAGGQGPYPAGGQGPYPAQGQGPYPAQGQGPYPAGGQGPYPAQGQGPYPTGGQGPYPAGGQGPYPSHGQSPYPPGGQGPNQPGGQGPYPPGGQGPYPTGGQGPYPTAGQAPASSQGPYPARGQAPYPPGGVAPYPAAQTPGAAQPPAGSGQAPYPPSGQQPLPNQSYPQAPSTGRPYPGQTGRPVPYPGQTQPTYPQSGQGPQIGAAGERVTRPGTDQFKSRVEIRIECRNLLNLDVMSKSDPCAVLYMMRANRWEEVGRTENVKNSLNPKFSSSFVVNYFFEEVQKVQIAVYDLDNITPQLSDDDFLGQIETTLGQLVSNTPFTAPLLLRNGAKAGQGTIILRTEEIKEGLETALMTFRAQKLDSKDLFGKSDPYLEFQKATSDGSWQVIHRTEVVKNNLNPNWRPFQLSLQALCGGNKQQSIKIDCYDWDSDGSHDYIGGFTTTFEEMSKAQSQEVSWPCVNPSKKAKKKSYSNSGTVYLTSLKLLKEYSFLDFIMGGTQINFTVGVDFTASNGNPQQSSSLHYINPHQPNEYMTAIKSVGEVCQDYDTDKLFPALGFGAKVPPKWEVSHEFALNFNLQNPYCQGIDGVLQAYYNCIQHVQLYGPTNTAPIINHVANFAAAAQREESSKGANAYYILLLLTDGVLSDMSNTRAAIVQASKLPMSLIIVGVGQADFTDMQILDGDNGVLRAANGEPAKRDIVQFVPFRDFKHSSSVELARHVLAEVPKQVTDYYKMRGLQPKAKPTQTA